MYFGGLYGAALRSPAVHLGLLLWSVLAGLVFFRVLLAGSRRIPTPRWLAFAGAGALAAVGVVFVGTDVNPAADWFAELARPWSIPGERSRSGAVVLILGALPVLAVGVATTVRRTTAAPGTASPLLPAQRYSARAGIDGIGRLQDPAHSLPAGRR